MDNKGIATILCILLLSLTAAVSGISVGTAPGVYDMGEVKPGRDTAFKFYLTTNAKSDVLVSMSYIKIHADIYNSNHTGRFTFLPMEASQENIESWVEIPRRTLLLTPENVKIINLEGGGALKAYGTVDVVVHVPGDAEPGFHAGAITLSPQVATSSGGGTGVVTFGVTRFIFVFRVAGNAVRKGDIMTAYASRLSDKRVKINVLFKNTGTCSMDAWIESLKLYDKFGNLTTELRPTDRKLVTPGKTVELGAYWDGNVKSGSYRAEIKVNYLTGYATLEERIDIPVAIKVDKKEIVPVEVEGLPWMTILLVVIIIILIWYYLKG